MPEIVVIEPIYQLPLAELIALVVLRLPSNLRQTAAIFAVLPLATDPVAFTVKTPDCVEFEEGVVKEIVGVPFLIVTDLVTVGLALPDVSTT